MQERKEFIQRIQDEIEDWEGKLEPLRLKAKLGEMEAREQFEALDKAVTDATRPVRTKLKELTYETGEAWLDLSEGCQSSWNEAKSAIKSAIARYTR